MNLKRHELSEFFPAIPPAAFKEMVGDIKRNGVRLKIVTYEGKVLDGWHRYLACKDAGIEPPIQAYRGNDPVGYVVSVNRIRRHMTASQLALVLASISKSKWAKHGGDRKGEAVKGPKDPLISTASMAKDAGVGAMTIKRAKKVIVNGSHALNAAVRDGDISVTKASEIADLPKKEQNKAIKDAGKKEKTEHPATVAWEKYRALEEKYDELSSNYEVLVDEVKTADAILKSDAAVEMLKLREELRVCRQSADRHMNRAAELRKQSDYWKGQAKRLGWKAK